MYDILEHNYQPKITKALEGPSPDVAVVLADAQAMLVKFDEMVAMVAKMPPLNALFDDVARLRIVRAHLREVNPALKAGNIAKARKSFEAFDNNWDSIEDLVKARSADAYVAIEKGMIEIEQALMPDKPDVDKVTALVNDIMGRYNAALAEWRRKPEAAGSGLHGLINRCGRRSCRMLRRWILRACARAAGEVIELVLLEH